MTPFPRISRVIKRRARDKKLFVGPNQMASQDKVRLTWIAAPSFFVGRGLTDTSSLALLGKLSEPRP